MWYWLCFVFTELWDFPEKGVGGCQKIVGYYYSRAAEGGVYRQSNHALVLFVQPRCDFQDITCQYNVLTMNSSWLSIYGLSFELDPQMLLEEFMPYKVRVPLKLYLKNPRTVVRTNQNSVSCY